MTFLQQLTIAFGSAAFTVCFGFILSLMLKRKWRDEQKQTKMPEDFAVFRERMERLLAERQGAHADLAEAVLRLQTDSVNLRGDIQWIKGRINGAHWKGTDAI